MGEARYMSRPPRKARGEEFDVWCYVMVNRGYALSAVARRARSTQTSVAAAVRRVEQGRYGDPSQYV